jgi:hypothetical protein
VKPQSGRGRKTGVAVLLALVAGAALGAQLSDADDLVTAGIATPPPRNGPVAIRVAAALKANPIPSGFLGLSIEYTALLPYAGTDAPTSVLVQLIRQLDPGQSPVLRFGGDTTDWSWVPVPGMAKPRGVHYVITPQWLDAAAGLVHALGAHVIFGVNLEANRPAVAATEATAFIDAVGLTSVEALEVGNEPEAYGFRGWYNTPAGTPVPGRRRSYSIRSYAREFSRFARVLPNVPLAGPATGSNGWMAELPRLLSAAPALRVVTVHRYPLNHCAAPGTEHDPSLARLLAPASSRGLAQSVAQAVSTAHAHGAELRVDELNSVACRGQAGISDTFASALWVLDTLFNLAGVDVDGVNIHTLPASVYHPFVLERTATGWQWVVDPLYYGMLMFAQAAPPGSHLLSISGSVPERIRVWATRAANGQTRIVLINDGSRRGRSIKLDIPGAQPPAAVTWLRAPSIAATANITLGGQSFGAGTQTGLLAGTPQLTTLVPDDHTYALRLPPASAALLTIPARSDDAAATPSRRASGTSAHRP